MRKYLILLAFVSFTFFATGFNVPQVNDSINQEDTTLNSSDEFDDFEEFDEAGSEFEEVAEDEKIAETRDEAEFVPSDDLKNRTLRWTLYALALTLLAGILVRFRQTRSLRGFFLLGSLFLFGFYNGGCPCMLSSIQDTFLAIMGYDFKWQNLLWFLGLIPLTYLFGKVWCGWICHLGAVQEFVYLPARFAIFRGETAMRVMKIIRWTLLVALVIQLAVMGSIYFCKIDPFKAIFSLMIPDNHFTITVILLGLLLLTSLFSYRPFCKSACPVGLSLGLISKIPGASVIGIKGECAGCKVCSKACNQDAIIRKEKFSILNNTDCIACGDCIDACNKQGLHFFRKSKKHPEIIHCKNDCKIG
ncbi:MAG: 4Fe-4S binding protein [Bacteroidales bacterium]|nr:4Fe-4S binding protein [Bacteroidales bacterium]